jgi:GH24 family phage-related lysozyme (muramidase)
MANQLRDPKTGKFITDPNNPSFKVKTEKTLETLAKDVSLLKISVLKLTKLFEDEKKASAVARQRQRADDYAAKYKKGPTKVEKNIVKEDKKSFLEMIKDVLSGIFKFALVGLASIGISKLLNMSDVMGTITDLTKKLIINISDVLQKGMSFIRNILNDQEVINSIFNVAKSVFKFIGDAIVSGANFFSKFVSDPENQQTISGVIVAIISGIANAIKAAYSVTKNLLSENSDALKEGAISVFLVIKDVIVGALKIGQNIVSNEEVKKQFQYIVNAILNFIGEVMNMPIFEWEGGKVTLKQALIGLAVATAVLQGAMQFFIGSLQGAGMKAAGLGGGGGGGGGGKGGNVPGKKSGYSRVDKLMGLGVVAGVAYTAYDAMTPDRTDRPTGPGPSPSPSPSPSPGPSPSPAPSPSPSPSPSPTPSRPVNQNPAGMPKSLEEYIGMEFERKKKREGFRTLAYASPEGGTDTIGIGHKLSKEEQDKGGVFIGGRFVKADRNTPLTEQQVKDLYIQDVMNHANGAKRQINKLAGQDVWSGLNPMQQYALMDLSFAGGPGLITKDLADAIKSGDMNKAAQIIQQKARTYQKNGVMVESKHHAKHADLRADIFRGYDPLLTGGSPTTVASSTPNEQRPSKSIPTQAAAATAPDMASPSMQPQEPKSSPSSDTENKTDGGSAISTLVGALSTGLTDLDKATGGKLGLASTELQALLRDKSFLEAFSTPIFADASKNVSTTDNVAMDEKTPSVHDENLLSRMRKS